jgi:hypothetical protein
MADSDKKKIDNKSSMDTKDSTDRELSNAASPLRQRKSTQNIPTSEKKNISPTNDTSSPNKTDCWLKRNVDSINALSSVIQTVAIIIGGFWVWYQFDYIDRNRMPRLEIQLGVSQSKLAIPKNKLSLPNNVNLLHVDMKLSNTGKSQLTFENENAKIYIQQVLPIPLCDVNKSIDNDDKNKPEKTPLDQIDTSLNNLLQEQDTINFCMISERILNLKGVDIEPGANEYFDFDFAVKSDVKSVRVVSTIPNSKKQGNVWIKSELYVFKDMEK